MAGQICSRKMVKRTESQGAGRLSNRYRSVCISPSLGTRACEKLCYHVRLVPAQFVKPYVKSNKNDKVDAEAICEAMSRPNMRFVALKTAAQQDNSNLWPLPPEGRVDEWR